MFCFGTRMHQNLLVKSFGNDSKQTNPKNSRPFPVLWKQQIMTGGKAIVFRFGWCFLDCCHCYVSFAREKKTLVVGICILTGRCSKQLMAVQLDKDQFIPFVSLGYLKLHIRGGWLECIANIWWSLSFFVEVLKWTCFLKRERTWSFHLEKHVNYTSHCRTTYSKLIFVHYATVYCNQPHHQNPCLHLRFLLGAWNTTPNIKLGEGDPVESSQAKRRKASRNSPSCTRDRESGNSQFGSKFHDIFNTSQPTWDRNLMKIGSEWFKSSEPV